MAVLRQRGVLRRALCKRTASRATPRGLDVLAAVMKKPIRNRLVARRGGRSTVDLPSVRGQRSPLIPSRGLRQRLAPHRDGGGWDRPRRVRPVPFQHHAGARRRRRSRGGCSRALYITTSSIAQLRYHIAQLRCTHFGRATLPGRRPRGRRAAAVASCIFVFCVGGTGAQRQTGHSGFHEACEEQQGRTRGPRVAAAPLLTAGRRRSPAAALRPPARRRAPPRRAVTRRWRGVSGGASSGC